MKSNGRAGDCDSRTVAWLNTLRVFRDIISLRTVLIDQIRIDVIRANASILKDTSDGEKFVCNEAVES